MQQLTETEALAKCLARPLFKSTEKFGADQAKEAVGIATSLLKADAMDAETFGRVISRLGNHSAIRQWAVAHGFITTPDDALATAMRAEMEKVEVSERAEMEKLTKK